MLSWWTILRQLARCLDTNNLYTLYKCESNINSFGEMETPGERTQRKSGFCSESRTKKKKTPATILRFNSTIRLRLLSECTSKRVTYDLCLTCIRDAWACKSASVCCASFSFFPPSLIWSFASSHPPSSSPLSYSTYREGFKITRASSEMREASQPYLFELLLMLHQVLAPPSNESTIYPLLHPRAQRFPHNYLATLWLTGSRVCHPALPDSTVYFAPSTPGHRWPQFWREIEFEPWWCFFFYATREPCFIHARLSRKPLTFQSMVAKKWCLLISSTPSGPAPMEEIKLLQSHHNFPRCLWNQVLQKSSRSFHLHLGRTAWQSISILWILIRHPANWLH